MTRRGERPPGNISKWEGLPVRQEPVELRAVRREFTSHVEQRAERLLHLDHASADPGASAELSLEVVRRRQMVGMNMGLENPLDVKTVGFHSGNQLVGRSRHRPPRFRVEIQYRIDDRGTFRLRVGDDVGDRTGRGIKKPIDPRCHRTCPLNGFARRELYNNPGPPDPGHCCSPDLTALHLPPIRSDHSRAAQTGAPIASEPRTRAR